MFRSVDGQLQPLEAAHQKARQPPTDFGGVDVRGALQQPADDDLSLQPSKGRPDTEVCTLTKGDVPLARRSIEPELGGIVEVGRSRLAAPHNSSNREPAPSSTPNSSVSLTTWR